MRPADRAWIMVGAQVAVWDLLCPPGETLSEGSHRHMVDDQLVTIGLIGYLAAHLMGIWPRRYDPLSRLSAVIVRTRRQTPAL